jgi:fluoroquinolone resistance protein
MAAAIRKKMNSIIEQQRFEKIDFSKDALVKADYEECSFVNCNFLNADLSHLNFSECEFTDCDLSNAKTTKTSLRDVKFRNCKMLGLHFEYCNAFLFAVNFDNCRLDLSCFYKMNLKKAVLKNCSLRETDLTEADLSGALLDNCDLALAVFENTILEKADLRSAFNYSIDPEKNRLKKAKFSKEGISGLLDAYDIVIE